jgi:hypothetical protein
MEVWLTRRVAVPQPRIPEADACIAHLASSTPGTRVGQGWNRPGPGPPRREHWGRVLLRAVSRRHRLARSGKFGPWHGAGGSVVWGHVSLHSPSAGPRPSAGVTSCPSPTRPGGSRRGGRPLRSRLAPAARARRPVAQRPHGWRSTARSDPLGPCGVHFASSRRHRVLRAPTLGASPSSNRSASPCITLWIVTAVALRGSRQGSRRCRLRRWPQPCWHPGRPARSRRGQRPLRPPCRPP